MTATKIWAPPRILLAANQSLGGAHIFVAVINAYDYYMLGRNSAIFPGTSKHRLGRGLEMVILNFGVRELACRFYILPLAGIHRVFGPFDGVKTISRPERNMNLSAFESRRQIFDAGRRCIYLEPAPLS